MTQHDGKIFGIGFYKTGTTTLYDALRMLGYHTSTATSSAATRAPTTARRSSGRSMRATTACRRSTCSTRSPTTRTSTSGGEIYALFPDAKYILTVRDEERWIDSCVKFFRHRRMRPMRVWMFGPHANPARDEASRQAWLDAYRAHNAAVRDFFATRGRSSTSSSTRRARAAGIACARSSARRSRTSRGRTPIRPSPTSRGVRRGAASKQALGLELRDAGAGRRRLMRAGSGQPQHQRRLVHPVAQQAARQRLAPVGDLPVALRAAPPRPPQGRRRTHGAAASNTRARRSRTPAGRAR